ncbi:transcriptional regulator NosR [Methylophaga sp. OBS4]|uniref:transcriptional regulator NosR n=1 Tax=Methylophaga sp. OBS4 TaxID=2991935 RepID=UPI00225B866D|nr:NosR/NirI family protein [Methylophaga sp. OBS4]MCX4187935.1 NosR/NirI family protein [Methylophaga sp. OBS4]
MMFSRLSHHLLQLVLVLLLLVVAPCLVHAMQPVSFDEQTATLNDAFPAATKISDKVPFAHKQPELRTIYQGNDIIGYAFETVDVVDVAAYSGKPVNLLVAIDTEGEIKVVRVLEHHEPILLVGIPEQRLFDFANQLLGMQVGDHVIVGRSGIENAHSIDSVSGATVTVMVVNEVVMRSARKVAGLLGIGGLADKGAEQAATINKEVFSEADWSQLTGEGAIRRLQLSYGDIDQAFEGTKAAFKGKGKATARKQKTFIDLYYTLLDIPTVGRNLLGDDQYNWLTNELKPGEHAIAVFGNGDYSFKGSGYVRGGIFDRIQIQQADKSTMFRDSDFHRLNDVYLPDMPDFSEMAIFIIRDSSKFDIGKNWQLELLVRKQVGALDSVITRFSGDYTVPEKYIERPSVAIAEAQEEALWVSVWRNKVFQITVLSISLLLLFSVIVMQDVLVKYPRFIRIFRLSFLVYTLFFIGWYTMGQLSIVNVFTFVHSVMGSFKWDTFLLDPVMFILWSFVAVTLLLWGRGIFCGWLCPFGALQELISEIARKLRVRQFELPFSVHERLWALKYLILLILFAISLESMSEAERYAEVEPFKTVIMLKFQREWGYVLYAAVILLISAFTHKAYCRYVCPLGAALAIPSKFRLFDWLKRRKECGTQCQICANECEIQAIHPSGKINANECHWCLDCQVTYHDELKCPPLVKQYNKRHKMEKGFIPIAIVEEKKRS